MAIPALARLPASDDDTKIRISELKDGGVSTADLARRYHLSPLASVRSPARAGCWPLCDGLRAVGNAKALRGRSGNAPACGGAADCRAAAYRPHLTWP
jgi:hypothetical protein